MRGDRGAHGGDGHRPRRNRLMEKMRAGFDPR
jgi:hypothetical protein